MVKKSLVAFFCLLIFGCQDQDLTEQQETKPLLKISSALVKRIKDARNLGELLTLKKTVHLETSEESIIGSINTIGYLPERNLVVILDKTRVKSVFLFDETGRFIRKIGKPGKGPGEISYPQVMAYSNKRIVLFSSPPRYLFFDLEGNYLKQISFNKRGWNIFPTVMRLWKDELYIYSNNPDGRRAPDRKEYPIFRYDQNDQFVHAYGTPEENYDWNVGCNLIPYLGKMLYSDAFSGNVYQINPFTNEHSVFCALGELYDVTPVRQSRNSVEYLISHTEEIDSILDMGAIENLLFIEHRNTMTIVNPSGEIIRRDLSKEINLPSDFEFTGGWLGYTSYENGFILHGDFKSRITEENLPNPSLLFYELKEITSQAQE